MPYPQANSSSSKKNQGNQGYGLGANIDGIPLGNRSPPRNNTNSNNSLQGLSNGSGSPNLENMNQNYNNNNPVLNNGTSDIL